MDFESLVIKEEKEKMRAKSRYNYLNQKGITLTVLVITIIVLLILAGVSINALFNENGIISKTKNMKNIANEGVQNDIEELNNLNGIINNYSNEDDTNENSQNIKVSSELTTGQELFSSTVTLNISLEETKLTLNQRKEIAAFLCDFSSYEELAEAYINEETLKQLNMTEEQLIDKLITIGRRFIDYRDTSKLVALGVKIITVETPYGSTLYTSNLGEPVKCSFNKNGTYNFTIKSGKNEKRETVVVNNIRTASTDATHKVKFDMPIGENILYSTDNTDNWQKLNNETVVECNNAIYIKFGGSQPEYTSAEGLHYVEKNSKYYTYFNDEQIGEWGMIRYSYLIAFGFRNWNSNKNGTMRQFMIGEIMKKGENTICSQLYTSRFINFATEFPEGLIYKIAGSNEKFTTEMLQKYPELELGYDNVITWGGYEETEETATECPVYKLEVNNDMSIFLYVETWD